MCDWYVPLMVLPFIGGALLERWAWRARIRFKARSGLRLECGGRLYDISESKP